MTKKIFKTFIFAMLVMVIVMVMAKTASPVFAQEPDCKKVNCLNVPIPTDKGTVATIPRGEAGIAQYIKTIYQFSLGIGALLAVAMIVFGGIEYTVSAGNVSKQQEARDRILNAVYGLALLMAAVLILFTINPNLVKLGLPTLKSVKPPPSTNNVPILDIQKKLEEKRRTFEEISDARKKFFEEELGDLLRAETRDSPALACDNAIFDKLAAGGLSEDERKALQQKVGEIQYSWFKASELSIQQELNRELELLSSVAENPVETDISDSVSVYLGIETDAQRWDKALEARQAEVERLKTRLNLARANSQTAYGCMGYADRTGAREGNIPR